jgi:saccharopine dehydrogenase-like NADP-dependent oxidoreductase
MMAARARDAMERIERLDIFLLQGLGDHHGKAALAWFFENLDATYEVKEDGRSRTVRSFGESRRFSLPGERKERSAYRFNFSDQHVLGRTLDAPAVSTWICFDNRAVTWLFAALSRVGLGRLMRKPGWRAAAVWLFMNIHIGSDVCAVAVRATGKTKSGGKLLDLGLAGRKEASMTAIVAAETARQVLSKKKIPGIFHSDQAIALDPVVAALKRSSPDLVTAL